MYQAAYAQAYAPVAAKDSILLPTPALPTRVAQLNVAQSESLHVGCTDYPLVSFADLRPGDIGFQFQDKGRGFRQYWIGVGNHLSNLWRPHRWADPAVMHSFVVVYADQQRQLIHTVDAAGGNLTDIAETDMDFSSGVAGGRVIRGAKYVFMRPTNPTMAQRIVGTALNWAAPDLHNFSIRRAVASPFSPMKETCRSDLRALSFAAQAGVKGPVLDPNTGELVKMMCSEFVTNVCAAATLNAWREEHPDYVQDACTMLDGLHYGPMGDAFAVNARGVTPALLQRRMEECPGMQPVGYIKGIE